MLPTFRQNGGEATMFPFLAVSKRIFDSPLRRAETLRLRQVTKSRFAWLRRLSYIVMAFATIMATVPLWFFVTDDYPTYFLIPLMFMPIVAAQVFVGVRTILLASSSMRREIKPG